MTSCFETMNLNKTSTAKLTCLFLRKWPHHTWHPSLDWKRLFYMHVSGILSSSFRGLENAWNLLKRWEKPGILTQNLKTNWNWQILCFQASLFKMSFTKIILIYFFVISTLLTQNTDSKPNLPWISLLLSGNNLENTWNFLSQKKWEPCICFNTFQDFYN